MRILFFFLVFTCSLFGKTVCLNMIVKNESAVIERCLTSVLPLMDTWVIVDTGSTDGTQEIIRTFFAKRGIAGSLYERPWKNFSHNRNEAMELAKGHADYLFFIDADEYLQFEEGFQKLKLDKDFYYGTISHSGSHYARIQLIDMSKEWAYEGVLHEVLAPKLNYTYETIPHLYTIYTTEGARSKDPNKYQKDAEVFQAALKEDPENSRYIFYLAQSFRDAKQYDKALESYERRIQKGGWEEEVYWSYIQAALMREYLEEESEKVIEAYLKALHARPSRFESYYYLGKMFQQEKRYEEAYQILAQAEALPKTKDILFVQSWMLDWAIPLERAVAAYWTERYKESAEISFKLLKEGKLPKEHQDLVERNLGFALEKYAQQVQ